MLKTSLKYQFFVVTSRNIHKSITVMAANVTALEY